MFPLYEYQLVTWRILLNVFPAREFLEGRPAPDSTAPPPNKRSRLEVNFQLAHRQCMNVTHLTRRQCNTLHTHTPMM